MTTDTSEKGLESLIVESMLDSGGLVAGDSNDYDRAHAVDLAKLSAFLKQTQPEAAEQLDLDHDSSRSQKFLARLQGQIAKDGVIHVLRNGFKDGPLDLNLFCGTPSPGNEKGA